MKQPTKKVRLSVGVLSVAVWFISACSYLPQQSNYEAPEVASRLLVSKPWSHSAVRDFSDSYLHLAPLIKKGRVYVSGPEGRLAAFRIKDGKRLWQRSYELNITAGIGGGRRSMIVGTVGGEVIAFSLESGEEVWRRDVGDEVTAVSAQHRGVVLVRTADKVIVLDASSGNRRWQYKESRPPLTIKGASVPVFHREWAFIGLDNGYLMVINLKDGRVLREMRLGVDVGSGDLDRIVDLDGRMVVKGGVLYAAAYQGRTIAVDLERGNIVWTIDMSSQSGLDVGDKAVFITTTDNRVVALSRRTGKEIWFNDSFQDARLSAPQVVGSFVVVGDGHGHLYWLSKKSGKTLERTNLATDSPAEFRVSGKNIITLDREGHLSAVRLAGYRKR